MIIMLPHIITIVVLQYNMNRYLLYNNKREQQFFTEHNSLINYYINISFEESTYFNF